MSEYYWNNEAEKIAFGLITQYHGHLQNLKIAYLTHPKTVEEAEAPEVQELGTPRKRGRGRPKGSGAPKKVWIAKAALVNGKYRAILNKDYRFVITVNQEYWDQLSLEQQTAVMDHELTHCVVNTDNGKCGIRKHDLEEFRSTVARHGFYLADVQAFAEVCIKKGMEPVRTVVNSL